MKQLVITILIIFSLGRAYPDDLPAVNVSLVNTDGFMQSEVKCVTSGFDTSPYSITKVNLPPSFVEAYLAHAAYDNTYSKTVSYIDSKKVKRLNEHKARIVQEEGIANWAKYLTENAKTTRKYFKCDLLREKYVLAYIQSAVSNSEHIEKLVKQMGVLGETVGVKVSRFSTEETRTYLTIEEKSEFNALGTIRTFAGSSSYSRGQMIGNAQVVKLDGVDTSNTIIVTSAHVFNDQDHKGVKEFCIGSDPADPRKRTCYKIIDLIKGSNKQLPHYELDWAVLVLDTKIESVIEVNGGIERLNPLRVSENEQPEDMVGTPVTNITYSYDIEQGNFDVGAATMAWPTKVSCSFKQKKGRSLLKESDYSEINDCQSEVSNSGSFFVKSGKNEPYLIAINDGDFGANLHYGASFNPDNHYNRALKVRGNFHKAIIDLSLKYQK